MEILRVETSALVGIGYRAVSHSRYAVPSLGDSERYSGASQGTPVGRYSRRPLRGAPARRKTLRERRPTRANRRGDADGEEKKRDVRAWAPVRDAMIGSSFWRRSRAAMAVAADRYRPRSGRMCDNQVARKWWDAVACCNWTAHVAAQTTSATVKPSQGACRNSGIAAPP